MIRLHLRGDGPPDDDLLADVLRAVANAVARGARSGETPVEAWAGRPMRDIDFGGPLIINGQETWYVDWSLTWDSEQ